MLNIQSLTALEHFRLRVSSKPEIVEEEIAPGLVCFSVMKGVATGETYTDDWFRECRGIVFSTKSGYVVGRPLHKFFNVGERPETQIDKLNWADVACVMEKRDGSMIHTVYDLQFPSGVALKTKKKFNSSMAEMATKIALRGHANKEDNDNALNLSCFIEAVIESNSTVIFEYTSPNNRIVIGYPKDELQVLHIRTNSAGYYWTRDEIRKLADKWNVKMVDEVTEFSSFGQMIEAAKTRENIEGWIVQFKNGEMVKIKTEWYMRRHRVMTYWRERDIAELIMNEEIDDVKAMFKNDGVDITPILEIELKYAQIMAQLIMEVDLIYDDLEDLAPREAAQIARTHGGLGSLAMALYNKKQPRYLHYFRQNLFKENFSLDAVGSLTKVDVNDDSND